MSEQCHGGDQGWHDVSEAREGIQGPDDIFRPLMNILSWIGCITTFIGVLLVANKNIWCWPMFAISSFFWMIYGMATNQPLLTFTEMILVLSNVYGFVKWMKAASQPTGKDF
jgi:hypothetical protein